MGLRRHKSLQSLTNFLHQIFRPVDYNEGTLFLSVWPTSGVSLDHFEAAIQKAIDSGFMHNSAVKLIWRLRNTSPSARGGNVHDDFRAIRGGPWALLASVDHPDDLALLSESMHSAMNFATHHGMSDRRDMLVGSEAKHYRLVQRYEGKHGSKATGTCIVAVSIQPAEGQEDDINLWYRKEHLAVLSANPTFIRSTRYVQRSFLTHGSNLNTPLQMLALHEYTSSKGLLDHAIAHGPIAEETPWSERIFQTAVAVERTIWDITSRHHRLETKAEKL